MKIVMQENSKGAIVEAHVLTKHERDVTNTLQVLSVVLAIVLAISLGYLFDSSAFAFLSVGLLWGIFYISSSIIYDNHLKKKHRVNYLAW